MKIWVDADACPRPVKEILFRAAERCQVEVVLVANQPLATPPSRFVRSFQVGAGYDKADDEIVQRVSSGDLVITSDIPLAADVIERDAIVLSPRGEALNASNIRARLNMRDFLDTMRSSGYDTGGPAAYSEKERKQFADHLDRLLAKHSPEPE